MNVVWLESEGMDQTKEATSSQKNNVNEVQVNLHKLPEAPICNVF